MRNDFLLGISALFLVLGSFGQPAERAAHADIYSAKGEKIGTATLREVQGGVKIDVEVPQLPPGLPDDNLTDPAGNADARIACGLVQK